MISWLSYAETTYEKSIEEKEEEFNNVVREYIINLLTFLVLYICAYFVVARFHQKKERDGLYGQDEDAKAYRISFYLCTFTLAVSFGSVLMLPMSMLGNEVVHLFPDSYWVQWLNGALVHTFWKWMFYLSNLSLFILLPFSYFFTESEGFSGQRRGLMPRVYETIAVLMLLALLVFGLAVLALAFFDNDNSAQLLCLCTCMTWLNRCENTTMFCCAPLGQYQSVILLLVGEYYLQYLYSFLLCLCMLFIITGCAPFGFLVLFDAVGQYLVKPKIFENNENRILTAKLEEESIKQKLQSEAYMRRISSEEKTKLKEDMESTRKTRIKLERRKNASALERNLGYPLVILIILALTGLAFLLVSFHIVKLIFIGDNELHPSTVTQDFREDYRSPNRAKMCQRPKVADEPVKSTSWWKFWWYEEKKLERQPDLPDSCRPSNSMDSPVKSLGANSLSSFGIFGTILEVLVIFYLTVASVVGLYHLPGFWRLRPEVRETTMTKIILNCLVMQLLSSSLPVLSRVLGITDFELQGRFGDFYWLGNFYVVFGFNIIFAVVTALCLVNKMTKKVRRELLKALKFNPIEALRSRSNRPNKALTSSNRTGINHSTPETSPVATPAPSTPRSSDKLTNSSALEATSKQLEEKIASLENDLNNLQQKRGVTFGEERPPFCCSPTRSSTLVPRAVFKTIGNASST